MLIPDHLRNFTTNAIITSAISAGVSRALRLSNPKAAAVGALTATIAGQIFEDLATPILPSFGMVASSSALASLIVFGVYSGGLFAIYTYCGSEAGKQIDPTFSYKKLYATYLPAAFTVFCVGKLIGVR